MKISSIKWKVHLITALLFTLFLFYIDEGYYSFRWMLEPGGWVAYVIYSGVMWLFQMILTYPLKFILKDPTRTWISSFFGTTLGLLFVVFVIFKNCC